MNDFLINSSLIRSGSALVSGGTQGALYYDGKIYQFGDGGYCQVLNMNFEQLNSFRLPQYADNSNYPHCSSVEWIIPGQKVAVTTNATGLVNYADRVYVYDITDTDNITQEVVMLDCTDRTKYARMACMAYDQVNKVMYIAGYASGAQKSETSPCWCESFDFSSYIDNGTLSASRILQKETSEAGLHLQDGAFYNGYIYFLCDNSNTTNSSYDGLYIWVLDTSFNTVTVINYLTTNRSEAESFCIEPGATSINCISSIMNSGVKYYSTVLGMYDNSAKLTLATSTNVIGYTINGTENYNDSIELGIGTYSITPIINSFAEFYAWSDGDTALTRTFTITDTALSLTSKAIRKTVYMYGLPAITTVRRGISVSVQATTPLSLIQSSNNTYLDEYVLVTNGKYNDEDGDIITVGTTTALTSYFTQNNINVGDKFYASIPEGCTKFTVTFFNGDGSLYTDFGSRNPNIILCLGDSYDKIYKVQSNDVYRPLTNGATYDLSAIKFTDGTKAVTKKTYNLLVIRMNATSERLNDGYVRIDFE